MTEPTSTHPEPGPAAEASESGPAIPAMPDRDPDVHTRTRVLRPDWWRVASDRGPDKEVPDRALPKEAPNHAPAEEDWWRVAPDRGPGDPDPLWGVPQRNVLEELPEPASACAPSDEEPRDVPEEGHQSRLDRTRHLMTKGLKARGEKPADEDDGPTEGNESQEEMPGRAAGWRPSWGSGVQRPQGPPPSRPVRQSLAEWWVGRTREQRFLLTNGAAAAVSAYGPGMFSGRWDVGIPQLVLSAMHDAAEQYTDPATPLVLGAGAVLSATVAGGILAGFFLRFLSAVPTLCRALHWLLVRVPVSGATVAVLLFTTH